MSQSKFQAFINDKLIQFEDVYSGNVNDPGPGVQILSQAGYPLSKLISTAQKKDSWTGAIYLSDSPEKTWQEFVGNFKLQEAAGGLIQNENEQYLIIFRKGKWDLPKGKIDYNESPPEAALREVREECGLEQPEIIRPLELTFHSYPQENKQILKKTHWYLMFASADEKPVPQEDEDIELVQWMDRSMIETRVYSNTYNSIKRLLEKFFSDLDSFETDKT